MSFTAAYCSSSSSSRHALLQSSKMYRAVNNLYCMQCCEHVTLFQTTEVKVSFSSDRMVKFAPMVEHILEFFGINYVLYSAPLGGPRFFFCATYRNLHK